MNALSSPKPDYTPKNEHDKRFYQEFDKVYTFQGKLYTLYGRNRFRGVGFIKEPRPDLSRLGEESVAEHTWSALVLWEAIIPLLPNLLKGIDHLLVSQCILIHDIGELGEGDISAVRQLQGEGENRQEKEQEVFDDLCSLLPSKSQKRIQDLHHLYETEKNNPDTTNKEMLLAKILDMLQGDHFVLIFGKDFLTYGPLHNKVIQTKVTPYIERLWKILIDEGNTTGANELQLLINHHLYQYQKRGAVISPPAFAE